MNIYRVLLGLLLFVTAGAYGQERCDSATVDTGATTGSWGYGLGNHRCQSDTQITASNVKSLELAWVYKLDDKKDPHSFPLVTKDSVVVGSRARLVHALDKNSGCLRWRFDAGADIRAAVVAGAAGLTYFGTAGGEVVALQLADGQLVWRQKVFRHFGAPAILHALGNGRKIVLAGQKSGIVYALNADDGSELWRYRYRTSGWITNRDTEGPARSGLLALDIAKGKEGPSPTAV